MAEAAIVSAQDYAVQHSLPLLLERLYEAVIVSQPVGSVASCVADEARRMQAAGYQPAAPPRERSTVQDVQEYLEEHRVAELLETLCASLLFAKPPDPLAFIVTEVDALSKAGPIAQGKLFSELDIRGLFALLQRRDDGGSAPPAAVPAEQVKNALASLGIRAPKEEALSATFGEEEFVMAVKRAMKAGK